MDTKKNVNQTKQNFNFLTQVSRARRGRSRNNAKIENERKEGAIPPNIYVCASCRELTRTTRSRQTLLRTVKRDSSGNLGLRFSAVKGKPGVQIAEIVPGGPAEKAGLVKGQVILSYIYYPFASNLIIMYLPLASLLQVVEQPT